MTSFNDSDLSPTALKILWNIMEEELKSKEETKESASERSMVRFRGLYGNKLSEEEYKKFTACAKELDEHSSNDLC